MRNRREEKPTTSNPPHDEIKMLSLNSQNEILLQLIQMLRNSLLLLRIIGAFQLGLAIFYAGLLLSRTAPVYFEKAPQGDWLGRYTDNPIIASNSSPLTAINQTERNITSKYMEVLKRQAEKESLLAFLENSKDAHKIGPGSQLVLGFCVGLLAVGGFSTIKGAGMLRFSNEFINSLLHFGDGETPLNTCSERERKKAMLLFCIPKTSNPLHYLKCLALHPLWNHQLLASLSLWQSGFWLLQLHLYHQRNNKALQSVGLPGSSLYLGVTDRFMDLILALWQPLFHFLVSWMMSAVAGLRDQFLSLAEMRYEADKFA